MREYYFCLKSCTVVPLGDWRPARLAGQGSQAGQAGQSVSQAGRPPAASPPAARPPLGPRARIPSQSCEWSSVRLCRLFRPVLTPHCLFLALQAS